MLRMLILLMSCLMLGLTAPLSAHAEMEPDPNDIVLRADRIRFPEEGFQLDVTITTTNPERDPEVREYRILSKGNDNTIVLTTAPASEKGQMMLMKGRDFWVFMPSVSQPIRLPLSQKLTGQVANGDLARANFSGDYTPTILREENIEGRKAHVLELVAVDRGVTYPRVLYWVDKANYRPLKAEFYTLSNRLLKTCRFLNYKPSAGATRPSQLIMEDALKREERSVLEYHDITLRDLPDKVFTKDYLKKIE